MPIADANADTGAGATIAFSVTSYAAKIRSIQLPEWVVEDLEKSTLDTSGYKEYVSSDLIEPGEVSVTCLFPTGIAVPDLTVTATQTCTVTFPTRTAGAATMAGSGYFKSYSFPQLQLGTLQEATFVFKFDGVTGPTFTNA